MVQVVQDAVEYIQKRPEMFLRAGRVAGQELAERIVGDALILTKGPVTAFRQGDWWFVGCEEDWMARLSSGSVDDIFSKIVAFPEAGPNSMHSEVLLAAFSEDVLVKEGEVLYTVKGCVSEEDEAWTVLRRASRWKRGVAFRLKKSERQ
jgi:hypothetical protein